MKKNVIVSLSNYATQTRPDINSIQKMYRQPVVRIAPICRNNGAG